MKRLFWGAAAGLMAIGCSSQDSDRTARQTVPASVIHSGGVLLSKAPPVKVPASVSLTPTIVDGDRPTSPDALRAEFIRRFDADLFAPFVELAYWGDSTDAQRREYLQGVWSSLTMPGHEGRVVLRSPEDVKLIPLSEYEFADYFDYFPQDGVESIQLTPAVTHILDVTSHEEPGPCGGVNFFAIGARDGRYYFCTIDHP